MNFQKLFFRVLGFILVFQFIAVGIFALMPYNGANLELSLTEAPKSVIIKLFYCWLSGVVLCTIAAKKFNHFGNLSSPKLIRLVITVLFIVEGTRVMFQTSLFGLYHSNPMLVMTVGELFGITICTALIEKFILIKGDYYDCYIS